MLSHLLRLLSLHRAKPFHDARGDDTDWNEAILIGSGPFPTLLVPGGSSSRTAAGDSTLNVPTDAEHHAHIGGRSRSFHGGPSATSKGSL